MVKIGTTEFKYFTRRLNNSLNLIPYSYKGTRRQKALFKKKNSSKMVNIGTAGF